MARKPGFIPFCDPTEVARPPTGEEWLHEIKWDGYRAQAHRDGDAVTVYSRSGLGWSDQFVTIARALPRLPGRSVILDGEAVVLGEGGRPDFQQLRRRLADPGAPVLYYVFDLLWLDGKDMRALPLVERKRRLKRLLAKPPPGMIYVDHLDVEGREVYEHGCRLGLEGIVSKKADAPYKSGRQSHWLKAKCRLTGTYPVIAFVEKLEARPRRIASLYVGRREGDRLLYAGKVVSGFTAESYRELRELLDPLIRQTTPLDVPVKKPKATWVEPSLQVELAYSSTTDDGILRHPSYKGVRADLRAPAASPLDRGPPARSSRSTGDRSQHTGRVPRANILQLLPDAPAPDTSDLRRYFATVSDQLLEHCGRRPLKLVRSVGGVVFYHKGALPPVASGVRQLRIVKREGGEGTRLWVDDLEGLWGLVQMGVVELHPWNATVDDIESADRIVLDLDPGEGIERRFLVDTALKVRDLLQEEGLRPWPKVTGGKGYHVMAALPEPMPHDKAHARARRLAERIAGTDRRRYTVSASMTQRAGRLFIDYLRNGRGTTAVGAWSPRARDGFPIARPVTWLDVEKGIAPDSFTMDDPGPQPRRKARRT
ncbi:MAG TPA: DNA ligase D [Reyranellaceae bacterium]|nr:DNA ligase D [Reyranellaceae bacterium]